MSTPRSVAALRVGGHRRLAAAAALTAATVAAGVGSIIAALPAHSATVPAAAASPFAVPAGVGASVPFTGDANSYWESANSAFPQWLQVDLGASTSVSRIVLKLPPSTAWATRTQTLTVAGSANGSSFTTLVNSAGYTFNPATGNTVTITFTASSQRYLRLTFTANTGWPAGQVSEFEVYPS